jgi:hypothetical protein
LFYGNAQINRGTRAGDGGLPRIKDGVSRGFQDTIAYQDVEAGFFQSIVVDRVEVKLVCLVLIQLESTVDAGHCLSLGALARYHRKPAREGLLVVPSLG